MMLMCVLHCFGQRQWGLACVPSRVCSSAERMCVRRTHKGLGLHSRAQSAHNVSLERNAPLFLYLTKHCLMLSLLVCRYLSGRAAPRVVCLSCDIAKCIAASCRHQVDSSQGYQGMPPIAPAQQPAATTVSCSRARAELGEAYPARLVTSLCSPSESLALLQSVEGRRKLVEAARQAQAATPVRGWTRHAIAPARLLEDLEWSVTQPPETASGYQAAAAEVRIGGDSCAGSCSVRMHSRRLSASNLVLVCVTAFWEGFKLCTVQCKPFFRKRCCAQSVVWLSLPGALRCRTTDIAAGAGQS